MSRVMRPKPQTILFITSFVPVIAFKVIARVGDATLAQAKFAAVIGFVLAAVQLILSKKIIKHTTYLERAFLGFLAVGTTWVYLAPPNASSIFVENSTALLYFVLFLTTLIPQLFGYDPFTYTIAKQMTPEPVWNTLHFRKINLHLTYFWSVIFFVNFLSSALGHGRPLFSILIPLIIILGIGLPVVRIYPRHYLKRQFSLHSIDPSLIPDTAKELILRMPMGFDPQTARDLKAEIQFHLSGEGGGEMVLSISDGKCSFREGKSSSPTLTIRAPADLWLKIARQEINRAQALMDGLYDVKGDMNLLIRMGEIFRPQGKTEENDVLRKERRK